MAVTISEVIELLAHLFSALDLAAHFKFGDALSELLAGLEDVKGVAANARVSIQRVDEVHGNPMPAYKAMGSPHSPTPAQVASLNEASALPAAEKRRLENGILELTLPVNGLAVVEVAP